ncbi:MAG: Kelch repeat-containing protein [Candidatus Binataceae bacterium]
MGAALTKPTSIAIVAIAAAVMATTGWQAGLAKAGAVKAASKRSTWGRLLFIGDEEEAGAPSKFVAELYDPASNRFAVTPAMDRERAGAAASVITTGPNAGKVLIAGGVNFADGPLNSAELYDPATDAFIRGPNMTEAHDDSGPAAAIPSGPKAGWIIVETLGSTDLYNPFANAFTAGPEMNQNRISSTATTIPSGPNAGKILYTGGPSNSATTEFYDPASNTFEAGPKMHEGRWDHTATVIASGPNAGRILIAGGWGKNSPNEYFVPYASTELYDPVANRFLRGPNMKIARAKHTATAIALGPNAGDILIAGGQRGINDALSAAELYDAATNRFVLGPAMRSGRTDDAAVPIASGPNAGKILIAGGEDIRCSKEGPCKTLPLATTELYDPVANIFMPGPPMHGAPGATIAVQLPPSPPR